MRLETAPAFFVLDLEDAPLATGVLRWGKKILEGGAELLARSTTYSYAVFGLRGCGVSGGLSCPRPDKAAALTAALEEVGRHGSSASWGLDPGKGLSEAELAPWTARDPRPSATLRAGKPARWDAAGVVGGLRHALGDRWSGARLGVDVISPTVVEVVRSLGSEGPRVVSVPAAATGSDQGGVRSLRKESGFSADDLAALAGPAEGGGPSEVVGDTGECYGAVVDALLVGARPGVVDHEVAAGVRSPWVVPVGPVPVTARALAVLRRSGTEVLPDFVVLGGGPWVWAGADSDRAQPEGVQRAVIELLASLPPGDEGPWMEACRRAEVFLSTWQDRLPPYRPLA